jgi:hypothetical protein
LTPEQDKLDRVQDKKDRIQDKKDRTQDRLNRIKDKSDKGFLIMIVSFLFTIASMIFTLEVICLMKGIDGEVARLSFTTIGGIVGAIVTILIWYWKYGKKR